MWATTVLLCSSASVAAFAPQHAACRAPASALAASSPGVELDRRSLLVGLGGGGVSVAGGWPVFAADGKTVVVAGATGQTGKRVMERLTARADVTAIGGVRDVAKGSKVLEGKTVRRLDVVEDGVEQLKTSLAGADAVVCCTGFVPGNPFQMAKVAHAVDNLGTKSLVAAAQAAGVKKFVLVSSILTNGRAWGQANSPGFQITNAFGGVLDEKIEAERALRASGLDFTIVRPGGLKATPPTGELIVAKEDTLNAGEVSRDLVADVCVAALFDGKSTNKVVEIIEGDGSPKLPESKWFA